MSGCRYEPILNSVAVAAVENNNISIDLSRYRPGFQLVDPFKDYKAEDWHLPAIFFALSICVLLEIVLFCVGVSDAADNWPACIVALVAFVLTCWAIDEYRKLFENDYEEKLQLHPDYKSDFAGRDTDKTDAIVAAARLVSLVPTLVVADAADAESTLAADSDTDRLEQHTLWLKGTLQQREKEKDDDDDETEYYNVFVPVTNGSEDSDPMMMLSSVKNGVATVISTDLHTYTMELSSNQVLCYTDGRGVTVDERDSGSSCSVVKELFAQVEVDRPLYKWNGPADPTDRMPLGGIRVRHNDETHALFSYCPTADPADAADAAGER